MNRNKVEIVGIETGNLKTLTSKNTIELIRKYRETKQKEVFDEVIEGNIRLVLSIVNKFIYRGDNLDDLFQIGIIGLMKAINNFDINQNVMFSTYAVPMIEGEIKRYLRDSSYLRISRQIKDLAYQYMKEKEKNLFETGKGVDIVEFAKKQQVSEYQVLEAIESTLPLSSLEEPLYNDFEDSILLQDIVPNSFDENDKMITYLSLKQGIEQLNEQEKNVIMKRYYEGLSQVEIAKMYNISQAQVSRLEKNALIFLKKYVI
ncbi:MAG: sigma-70 family RNA polymerase sigma factor [Bacillales bacterium]|nr:sigma-70 family RNA polymerase sigma factor [Bacillales bacterium]